MPTASAADTARVLSTVLAPIVAQGPILRRPRMVALAERLDADRRAGRLMRGLRGKYGPDLLRLRVPGRSIAVVLSVADLRAVLLGSPEPYALANREKVAALTHFQPHGVLVSHGPVRAQRRRFNEEVLDTGAPVHRLGDAIAARIRAEAVLPERLTWDAFTAMWWPIVRRVVLGDGARDDAELTGMLTALRADANWAYLRPKRTGLRRRFEERLHGHLARAERGSLAEVLARTPAAETTDPEGQVPHWLFAFDAAGIAAYRALALLAAGPPDRDLPYLQASVLESVRLWPTTMVILRDSTTRIGELPAGTAFVIVSSYFHRDPGLPYADRFTPEIWLDGRARDNWSLVPFSGGPGECPGRNLVLFTTGTLLATLLDRYHLRPVGGLDPAGPLPGTLDHTALRFAVTARQRISAS
jgi:cytochrome P450